MRFAYIDSQGKEVTIPSIDALRLRIELKAIVEDTMFHDANSGKWAPAREHEIFRTLQRELQDLDAGSFSPPPLPDESEPAETGPAAPESPAVPEAGTSETGSAEEPAGLPPEPGDGGRAPGAGEAGDAGAGDDFGLGVTLDLVPEDAMEPEEGELDETAAAGPAGEALEGLEDLELAGSWDQGDTGPGEGSETVGVDADAGEDLPTGSGAGAEPRGDDPLEPGPADPPAEEGQPPAGPAVPERFAMSPQDDLMDSVPDPGVGDDLELEPGLADSFEAEALSAGTAASDELELESPLTDYDADQPPAWMQSGGGLDAQEPPASGPLEVEGVGDAPPEADAGSAAPDDGELPPMDGRDVPPAPDRGEPPARPTPRPRSAPPQRKLRKASTPGAGRFIGLVVAVAVVAAGGWYGFQTFAGGPGGTAGEEGIPLPQIPAELMPQMRQYAAAAVSDVVAAAGELPERAAIPARPDPDWLAGNYLAGASGFPEVPEYWGSVVDYVEAVEAVAPEAYRAALEEEVAAANLTADNAARIRERALAGWAAAAGDRQLVYDQLRAVAVAALDLHEFVVANEGQITYEPAAGGVSRDPVLEAVPASEEIGDAMWARVGDVTRALDNLGFLETVTTDGLIQTFLDKLQATPIR